MVKKKTSKKENKKESPPKKKPTHDKQLYWVLGVMVGLIAIFTVSSYIFEESKTFEYQGLSITKEKFGEIPVYRYSYYIPSITGAATGAPNKVNILFKYDPRELDVPVEGTIEYLRKNTFVYITINSTGILCEESILAVATLSSFIGQNGYLLASGSADEADAEANNLDYRTCETNPDRMVITLQEGQETSIIKEKDNCYTINVANCEILPAIEKFMIQSIIDANARE